MVVNVRVILAIGAFRDTSPSSGHSSQTIPGCSQGMIWHAEWKLLDKVTYLQAAPDGAISYEMRDQARWGKIEREGQTRGLLKNCLL